MRKKNHETPNQTCAVKKRKIEESILFMYSECGLRRLSRHMARSAETYVCRMRPGAVCIVHGRPWPEHAARRMMARAAGACEGLLLVVMSSSSSVTVVGVRLQ